MLNYDDNEAQNSSIAHTLILNTFDPLEIHVLRAHASIFPKLYTIGPLPLILSGQFPTEAASICSNLWKDDIACLQWLDALDLSSVMYVNLRSITVLTISLLPEFAWGFKSSSSPFLWILRWDKGGRDGENYRQSEGRREGEGREVLRAGGSVGARLVGAFLMHCNDVLVVLCGTRYCWKRVWVPAQSQLLKRLHLAPQLNTKIETAASNRATSPIKRVPTRRDRQVTRLHPGETAPHSRLDLPTRVARSVYSRPRRQEHCYSLGEFLLREFHLRELHQRELPLPRSPKRGSRKPRVLSRCELTKSPGFKLLTARTEKHTSAAALPTLSLSKHEQMLGSLSLYFHQSKNVQGGGGGLYIGKEKLEKLSHHKYTHSLIINAYIN
ncbi:UDP-glycosyltransferase 85A5 [Platanthera guangdongensis]|uniref:UDP-glycosyltransferase 85A5 n=1 Tax=Platanthera guangdongensis TaxID=2320717 RepID=A0ABR2N017_9ASPA